MWLSKLTLNSRLREVRRDLANPYEMHRTLSWAVSQALAEGRERLLWRVEPVRGQSPIVLVQTLTCPDWSEVLRRLPGYAVVDPASPKPFDPRFAPSDVLRFRLRANPSVKRIGKRYPILRDDGKMEWLQRKLQDAGCELLAGVPLSEEKILAFKKADGDKHTTQLTVYAVLFEGILRVLEPEATKKAIAQGIGPGKGLGLGLLSLGPVR